MRGFSLKMIFHRKDAKSAEGSGFYLAVKSCGKLKEVDLRVLCDSAVNLIIGISLLLGH
jgi:hypothetical protein